MLVHYLIVELSRPMVEPGEEEEIHMVTELLEALMAVPVEMEGLE